MGNYSRTPRDILAASERPFPEELMDVQTELNIRNNQKIIFDDFGLPAKEIAANREYVRERKKTVTEKHVYATFLESAVPQAGEALWFGDDVYVGVYSGESAEYNDFKGTDLIFEKTAAEREKNPAPLRVDVTKTSNLDEIKDKVRSTLWEIHDGRFTETFMESPTDRKTKKIIRDAPRVIFHLAEDQILELGYLIKGSLEKNKEKTKALTESPLQLDLIKQGKNQLENQILYALALFLEKVDSLVFRLKLTSGQKRDLIGLFEELIRLTAEETSIDQSREIIALAEKNLANKNFEDWPRFAETAAMIKNILPWLEHFEKLWQEKSDSLGIDRKRVAQTTPGQLLTARISQAELGLPSNLRLAA